MLPGENQSSNRVPLSRKSPANVLIRGHVTVDQQPSLTVGSAEIRTDRLFFIAGPCVIESESLCLETADALASLAAKHGVPLIFKASYDKANRTSGSSFRGIGKEQGLAVLERVRMDTGLPVITDVHVPADIREVAEVVDAIQIPAFLCRQTDLLQQAGATGKPVNIKKGQFMAPSDMQYAVEKVNGPCMLTERGTFFGYGRLVVDFAGLRDLAGLGVPVVFDATHSVQAPGGGQGCSSGDRRLALPLARAALCQGVNGLFFEVHPTPDAALCDGPNIISISDFQQQLPGLIELHQLVRSWQE